MAADTWTLSTLNLNGMRAAVRKGFRDWRPRSKADVICLQEVRMQPDQETAEHRPPRGWESVRSDAVKRGYSGVSAWSRLPVTGSQDAIGDERWDSEGRYVRLDTAQASVVSVYIPSGSSGEVRQAVKDDFLEDFLQVTAGLLAEGIPVAICGDFNVAHTAIDIHNPTGNKRNSGFLPHEREWMDRLLAQGWVDLFRHFHPGEKTWSWWSQRGRARELDRGWRLDYILASPQLAARAEACWITGRTPAVSDHCPVNARFAKI